MKSALITLGVIGLLAVVVGMTLMGSYNSLVKQDVTVDESWATVESQYQRRFDLIDNLVESVKGAQGQEYAVFKAIADARKQYINASSPEAKVAAANTVETNLALIPRLQEAYPELRSNDTLNRLMDEITGTENRINIARDRYNEQVGIYNKDVKQFPTNIIAGLFGMGPRDFFKSDVEASAAPKVDFSGARDNDDSND